MVKMEHTTCDYVPIDRHSLLYGRDAFHVKISPFNCFHRGVRHHVTPDVATVPYKQTADQVAALRASLCFEMMVEAFLSGCDRDYTLRNQYARGCYVFLRIGTIAMF
jgi:hypothetical protein